jgi:RND family efflux transporter MFP subunit
VREGSVVKKGDILVEIDPVNYRAQVAQAQASLELSEARLRQTEQSLTRSTELFARDLISREELERVDTEWSVQKAQVARDRAALEQALDLLSKTTIRSPLSGVVTQLNVEEGEVVVTGTMNQPGSVIMTVADLSEMKVEVEVDETQIKDIAPGQEADITVDALGDTTFIGVVETVGEAAVETYIAGEAQTNFEVIALLNEVPPKLRPGMSAIARIKTASGEDVLAVPLSAVILRDWEREMEQAEEGRGGRRSRTGAGSDESGESEGVEERPRGEGATSAAAADTTEGEGVSGSVGSAPAAESATARAAYDSTGEAAPADSAEQEVIGEVQVVYVVQDGKATIRRVETGIRDDNNVQILSGLELDEEVVTGPFRTLRTLRHGTPVKVDNTLTRDLEGGGERGGGRR